MAQVIEAKINNMTDEEVAKELAAVYNQMKIVKEMEEEDQGVIDAREALTLEKAPYTDKMSRLKKYAKAIHAVCKYRGIILSIKGDTND